MPGPWPGDSELQMIDVYYNVRQKMFSCRKDGRVIGHATTLKVENARFVVQEAGRLRVLRTGRKNVHAFVRGEVSVATRPPRLPKGLKRVRYNPRHDIGFMCGRSIVKAAKCVYLLVTNTGPVMLSSGISRSTT